MQIYRHTAAIVLHGRAAVFVNGYLDPAAKARQMLIHRIVHNLVHQVIDAAVIDTSNIHTRPAAHRLQALQYRNGRSIIDFFH